MHVCCAPCFTYPHRKLEEEGHSVTGIFFNPNIHPLEEYGRRLDALKEYQSATGLEVVYHGDYGLSEFLEMARGKEKSRCTHCYDMRLSEVAREASDRGFDTYSSSLLSSPWQKHDIIRKVGENQGTRYGVVFHYDDFRKGWQESIKISKDMGLYRQNYCGCIFSLDERTQEKAARK